MRVSGLAEKVLHCPYHTLSQSLALPLRHTSRSNLQQASVSAFPVQTSPMQRVAMGTWARLWTSLVV